MQKILFNWKINTGSFITLLILQLISIWLRKIDSQTYDCAETSATILNGLKLLTMFSSKARNEFPNGMEDKLKLLCQNKLADVVFKWDYKTQTQLI